MAQKLIMPVNQSTITSTFKNKKYYTRFGFAHYGIDIIGEATVWASGDGVVTLTGVSNTYGNFASVIYPDVAGTNAPFLLANYYHLSHVSVAPGEVVTKDSRVGNMGCTGKYVTGVHLHFEVIPYHRLSDLKNYIAPESLPNGSKINPLPILHIKKSAPDFQSTSFTNDGYCDPININIF